MAPTRQPPQQRSFATLAKKRKRSESFQTEISNMSSVLVVCETKDGRVKKTSREALSIGRKLAAAAGAELAAVAIGAGADAIAAEAGKFGAKRLYAVSGANVDSYSTEGWTGALEQV